MATAAPTIPQLFTELDRFGKDRNFEKALKIAKKSELKARYYIIQV